MLQRRTIFDYLTHVMVIWGIEVLSLCLFCPLFGEAAQEISTIFALGNAGISIETLLQFLGLANMISGLMWLFFTDKLIKKLSLMVRTIMMFVCVILAVSLFAAIFQWFPMNQVKPWIMFLVCFFVCAFISVLVSVLKEKSENRKMQVALERLKGEEYNE